MNIPSHLAIEKTSETDDLRILDVAPLPAPESLIRFFPIAGTFVEEVVTQSRKAIQNILRGHDNRLLVVIGPCSIHDPNAALDYAKKLLEERKRYTDTLEIVMRVYFEKPRTTVGWKGFINDPYLDGSFRINEGLRLSRQLLIDINRLGMPCASEFLDVISPQYIGDLIAWGAIGARTTESQVHRELASGLSAPIGFKNGTDGNVKIAIDAILAASRPHSFLSVHKSGQVAIVNTKGNQDCHVILRGGSTKPNYSSTDVADTKATLFSNQLPAKLMIDCSHANSLKQFKRQMTVAADIANQLKAAEEAIMGVMVESHLEEGAQKFTPKENCPSELKYGQSITDACLGWHDSLSILKQLSEAVIARRRQLSMNGSMQERATSYTQEHGAISL